MENIVSGNIYLVSENAFKTIRYASIRPTSRSFINRNPIFQYVLTSIWSTRTNSSTFRVRTLEFARSAAVAAINTSTAPICSLESCS